MHATFPACLSTSSQPHSPAAPASCSFTPRGSVEWRHISTQVDQAVRGKGALSQRGPAVPTCKLLARVALVPLIEQAMNTKPCEGGQAVQQGSTTV